MGCLPPWIISLTKGIVIVNFEQYLVNLKALISED
ncbi:hypothetical protein EABG_01699 [Escherichia coli H223]|nr:hypothetical protein EABG_01699 [Escherichia coli H223]